MEVKKARTAFTTFLNLTSFSLFNIKTFIYEKHFLAWIHEN